MDELIRKYRDQKSDLFTLTPLLSLYMAFFEVPKLLKAGHLLGYVMIGFIAAFFICLIIEVLQIENILKGRMNLLLKGLIKLGLGVSLIYAVFLSVSSRF